MLPFTPEQFIRLFADYNRAVWPVQVVAYLLGLGIVIALLTTARWWLLVIPLVWSLIGVSAAFLLAMPQDWSLLLSGVASLFILRQQRGSRHPKPGTSLRPR